MNPVKQLQQFGQAIWLDFLARGFIAKGDLKTLIDRDGVKGVTSNPSIFEKAIGSSDEYDGAISKLLRETIRRRSISMKPLPSKTFKMRQMCCGRFTITREAMTGT